MVNKDSIKEAESNIQKSETKTYKRTRQSEAGKRDRDKENIVNQ